MTTWSKSGRRKVSNLQQHPMLLHPMFPCLLQMEMKNYMEM